MCFFDGPTLSDSRLICWYVYGAMKFAKAPQAKIATQHDEAAECQLVAHEAPPREGPLAARVDLQPVLVRELHRRIGGACLGWCAALRAGRPDGQLVTVSLL